MKGMMRNKTLLMGGGGGSELQLVGLVELHGIIRKVLPNM